MKPERQVLTLRDSEARSVRPSRALLTSDAEITAELLKRLQFLPAVTSTVLSFPTKARTRSNLDDVED